MAGPTIGASSAGTFRVNPMQALQTRQALVNQTAENAGRNAVYEATCLSSGSGHFLQPDAVMFDATFVQQPQIYYGHYVDGKQFLTTGILPTISGGVYKWVQDVRGFFLGAQVYYAVLDTGVPGASAVIVEHHFTFSGIAIKDVAPDLLDK